GQVELLTTYIRKQFGKRPLGCRLPEYVWEQGLVSPLASCGMGFTFLSERQFAMAGAPADSPCICEDQGKTIMVFPVSQTLEAAFAGKGVSAMLEGMSRSKTGGGETTVSVFMESVAAAGDEQPDAAWNRFFDELSLCEQFAETVTPGKLYKRLQGLRKIYVPDSAGNENAVPARRFVIEHPQAGGLYSKMIFTNMRVNQVRGDKSRKHSAHEELWKAQGSAIFCRTGRHGIHDNALRNAAYSAMLGAERITREASKFKPSLLPFDFDMDGEAEWLFHETKLNCYVRPRGGSIFELDYLPKTWNYLDTGGGRTAFADRLLPPGSKVESLETGPVKGARICSGERYEPADLDKVRRKLRMVSHALPEQPDGVAGGIRPYGSIEIEKNIAMKKDTVCVGYTLANRGTAAESFCFSPEVDLSLPGETDAYARFYVCKPGDEAPKGSGPTKPAFPPGEALVSGVAHGVDGIKIHDIRNEVQITLTANKPFDARVLPLHLLDDATGARLFQAFCIMPLLGVALEAGETWKVEFALKFSH
ncbi:MAG: DUF1926 domain-containing protein, partial [Treponema sp.]|nr:DUF1926 domain-containing protein [Treponema sp.]